MDCGLEQFRLKFPEFELVDDSVVTSYLEEAVQIYPCSCLAQLYLTAHFIKLNGNGESGNSSSPSLLTKSEKVGDLAATYAVEDQTPEEAFFGSTLYGQKAMLFASQKRKRRFTVMIAGGM